MAKTPDIASGKALATLVSRDVGTVCRWIKRSDWPFGKPPWSGAMLPKILRWVADTLLPKEPTEEEATEAVESSNELKELRKEKLRKEIRKLHAQADAAETSLARDRGKLLDAETVEREWASIGSVVRNKFQNLASQIVPLALSAGMPHEAAADFQQQVEGVVAGILRHLSKDGAADDPT